MCVYVCSMTHYCVCARIGLTRTHTHTHMCVCVRVRACVCVCPGRGGPTVQHTRIQRRPPSRGFRQPRPWSAAYIDIDMLIYVYVYVYVDIDIDG